MRCLLNDKKITNWVGEEKKICNIFNTPEDKKNNECSDNNIFWIIHVFWEERLYPGDYCLPQQLLNDFKEILDNNNDIRSMGQLWGKYNEIKQAEYSNIYGSVSMKRLNTLEKENKNLMEENIKLVEKEDVRKKVQQWLENNADGINFKIGKGLFDILK